MGKGKKKEKKTGKKKSKLGKQVPKDAAARKDHISIVLWRRKVKNLVVLLASGQGDAYQHGELRMALRVMIKLVDEAEDLTWNSEIGRVKGLHPIFQRAAELTGISIPKLKEVFWHYVEEQTILVSDSSIRGRGSPNCDRTALRKLTPEHEQAIQDFVNYRNSTKGAGKVWLALPICLQS